ncbi:MAG: DMT family transporter [Chloroflexi bacterium]|nr:DMT family transporter [Chloroflexota bacterium]MCI0579712.1 DMT family transporter [Chloroflexota bacterium]MCI0644145.1 DMT family transporter [Chloroflexota bacterium]MCI0726235.1 DMT family transporter [Chloroflexota bacterium]
MPSSLLGQLAALGTAVCWSFTAIFFSYSGRQVGSQVVNRSRLLFALGFLTVTHLILEGTLFPPDAEPFRWGWLALSSLLGLVLGDSFLLRAYVLVGPRLAMLMMSSAPIWSTLLAWLFLGEKMTTPELAGIFLTVAAIGWVVTEKQAGRTVVENKQYSRGLLFGLGGALGQATNLITAKFGLVGGFPTISATWIRILVALVVLWAVAAVQGQVTHTIQMWRNRKAFPAIVGGTVAGPFLGIWLSLVAIQLARVGIASTLMALPPVLLIPLGYLIYRERVTRRAVAGTVVAFVGVALIFL